MRKLLVVLGVIALFMSAAFAQQAATAAQATATIQLPPPSTSGGMTLTEALAHRRSMRTFTSTPLSQAEISQLLWAAQGITDNQGRRTAPSAAAQYYLHVYLATADGLFEYIPAGHKLLKRSGQDLRDKLTTQPWTRFKPDVFIITGEYERASQKFPGNGPRVVNLEAGHAAQNVLLQATALGLAAVPVGGFEPLAAQKTAALPAQNVPIYLLPVGHIK